jgi:tetratricopeptide (TPR) repeat protein
MAQGTASIHGHVTNAAGQPVTQGEVGLTTDRSAAGATRKYDYTFSLDGNGNFKGTDIKPGDYLSVISQGAKRIDFVDHVVLTAGDDRTVDFDMSRPEYISKMTPDEKAALEEYKKNAAAAAEKTAQIQKMNGLLIQARADIKAANYDAAISGMKEATGTMPDQPILWHTLGDAYLGKANVLAKEPPPSGTYVVLSADGAYGLAIDSYGKALSSNAASAKPSAELAGAVSNQMGEAFSKQGKAKEAAGAFETAAKSDPANLKMYFYNEAVVFYNAFLHSDSASDAEEAVKAADRAIAADPVKSDLYFMKARSLEPRIVPSGKQRIAPPGLVEACNKYLELAPAGSHANDVRTLLLKVQGPTPAKAKK